MEMFAHITSQVREWLREWLRGGGSSPNQCMAECVEKGHYNNTKRIGKNLN